MDPKDFGFLDPDPEPNPQKYVDPRIRIQGAKYQPKTEEKKILLSKPKSEPLKKERFKNFLISEKFINFYQKNKQKKNKTKFENSALLKKFSKF